MATVKKAATAKSKLAGSVTVTLPRKVDSKTVHAALDSIFKLNGCVACGLGGIDLRLRLGDLINPGIENKGVSIAVH